MVNSMQNVLVVLFLFVFIFALIGMQFFANRFHSDSAGFVCDHNFQLSCLDLCS